ncbi:MAG: NTP transferase domain-containing protein [Betaproteobacteria bacterium]
MFPVAILAGGLGTRVASLTGGTIAKALLPVAGRPFIDRKIEELVAVGVTEIFLLIGHSAASIDEHFAASPAPVAVHLVTDGDRLLGTAGAIRAALDMLPPIFWVTYGDTFLDAPMAQIEQSFVATDTKAVMTVLKNEDRWQTSNVSLDDGKVIAYDKSSPVGTHRYIDYGLILFRAECFAALPRGETVDLSAVLQALISDRMVGAAEVTVPFRDIGTPEALAETSAHFSALDRARSRG